MQGELLAELPAAAAVAYAGLLGLLIGLILSESAGAAELHAELRERAPRNREHDAIPLRTQGRSDTDLPRALSNGEGHERVDTGGRKRD